VQELAQNHFLAVQHLAQQKCKNWFSSIETEVFPLSLSIYSTIKEISLGMALASG